MAEPSRRLFFALWPEPGLQRAIAATGVAAARTSGAGGRAVRIEGLHLTLVFLGQVAASLEPALHEAAAGVAAEPFTLDLDLVDSFARAGVLWVGCRKPPDALGALALALRERVQAAGVEFDRKPLVPHVTVLRDIDRPPAPAAVAPIRWAVNGFALVHSAPGSRYHAVSHWPLQTARK